MAKSSEKTAPLALSALLLLAATTLTGCGRNGKLQLEIKEIHAQLAELSNENRVLSKRVNEGSKQLLQVRDRTMALKKELAEVEKKFEKTSVRRIYLEAAAEDVERQTKELEAENTAYKSKFVK